MQRNHGQSALRRSRNVPDQRQRIHLTERDLDLLSDVFLQRVLSRRQIEALGYFHSTTVSNTRLRALFDGRFLRRSFANVGAYATEALYLLGPASTDLVAARLGIERTEVARYARSDAPSFLTHARTVTDVRIAFQNKVPGVDLEWFAECQVRHEYAVQSDKGRLSHVLKPDGAVLLKTNPNGHLAFLEVDLGHVGGGPWRKTCAGYRRYLDRGFHREAYGVESAEILCVTTAGERRIGHLAVIAAAERAPFRFTSLDTLLQSGPLAAIWWSADSLGRTALTQEVELW